jgi:hypothetical protein
MTSLDAAHEDIAAYALNLMTPDEAWRFEVHLMTCEQCTTALAELTPVADVLADVDAPNLIIAGQMFQEGRILGGMLESAAKQKSRSRALRLVTVAAGLVVVGIVSVLTAAVGWGQGMPWNGSPGANPTPAAQRPGITTQLPSGAGRSGPNPALSDGGVRNSSPVNGANVGTCDGAPAKQEFTATGPSGTQAKMLVSCDIWGTPIELTLSNIVGPMQCDIIVRTKSGKESVAMSWAIPAGGYGTADRPAPLTLKTVTDVLQPDINELLVRGRSTGAGDKVLVVVPLK